MADEYISKADVKNLRFSGGINHDGFLYVPYKELVDGIKALPPADVVGKADIMALLEETEKELAKGTDEMSIARCFIVSIMGIVKCKIMQMGEKKDG